MRADHPRIRGEHDYIKNAPNGLDGSSPHTRGAPRRRAARPAGERIIPAYAGSTSFHFFAFGSHSDHPRIRGEHVIKIGADLSAQGSSPHTRGARESFRERREDPGIIPAYAGSTQEGLVGILGHADHPRIRGEHFLW